MKREGHARVPAPWREDGYGLGGWVSHQRGKYKEGTLDRECRARLEALPGWTWNLINGAWEEALAHLRRFVERQGHARVPPRYREDGYGLGAWVSPQRARYDKGTLDPRRRARLEALGGWTWDPYAEDWEEGFAHLQRFVKREGHARVPARRREDGFKLGVWIASQRARHRQGTLTPVRRDRLESLPGWTWGIHTAAWSEGFANLMRFVEREGHARVPQSWREDGYRLGQWVGVQRSDFKKGQLGEARRERLEGLPGWSWHARKTMAPGSR